MTSSADHTDLATVGVGLGGRVALVTGASKGIGRAIALAFARAGADIAMTGRDAAELQRTADAAAQHGAQTLICQADFLDRAAVADIPRQVVQQFGRIDVLVNNAAIIHPPISLEALDDAVWHDVIEVNLNAAAMLTKRVVPIMREAGGGNVINISSIGGRGGAEGRSAYRVTKAALINLTESLAAEAWRDNIRVNCICPGGTDTEGYREAFGTAGRADNPRLMDPDDIAQVALFLASDASRAVTGTSIDAFGATNPLFSGARRR